MMKTIIAAGAMAAALAGWAPPAQAQGTPLLDLTLYGQLERWLGAGPLFLENVYTRQAGDDSLDFHAAADHQGSTFTLMRVSDNEGGSWLVGGYNPRSWTSIGDWNVSERDWQRTAFIFNYTDPAVYHQVPTSYILPSQGARQTYNASDHGPVFGAGPDLYVNDRMDTAISWQLTYGNPENVGFSIIDGSQQGQFMHLDALEIYSIALIPEPGAAGMLAAGLGVLGWVGWRRRRQA
ncbi:PEP_CTERM-anchored TLD domain-containing protein [Massilia niastensis]|uniref:PEP_CTERM-anchored TLD domain-containing protein n=1 Tax=Massilia niastensis TaxID=544911 RepID=UPI00036E2C0D|nr:PEP_CTERM-anchored TLD domain-containing protein [Massilia niastensis]